MQSIGGGPFVAGHIDPTQTLFNLGIDTGVFPGEGDTFVLVEVIDLIRGIARAALVGASLGPLEIQRRSMDLGRRPARLQPASSLRNNGYGRSRQYSRSAA